MLEILFCWLVEIVDICLFWGLLKKKLFFLELFELLVKMNFSGACEKFLLEKLFWN